MFLLGIFTAFHTFKIGQDANFDLLNYHFFTGYSYLTDHSADIAPANIQTFTHPGMNVLSYFAYENLIFPFSAWLILFFQLLSVPAIMLIADEISLLITGKRSSLEKNLALLICSISPLWLSELGTSFFSSTTAPLVLWSLYFIIRKNKNYLIEGCFAGVLMGLALGLKLTNAPFVIGAAVAVLLKTIISKKEYFIFFMAFSIGGIVGILLTSHWYWELWKEWGNPLFPFYNKIFHSPYFDLINWRDNRWVFHNFSEYYNFVIEAAVKTNKTSEVPFKDIRILLISIAPIFLLLRYKTLKINNTLVLLAFFYVSYLLWAMLFAYQRYAIPLEILYGIIIWITLSYLTDNKKTKNFLLIAITILNIYHFNIPDWGHIEPNKEARNPFSLELPENFIDKPARYLVDGVTTSYILANLNPKSEFYGIRFSHQVDELIKKQISESGNLPVRIITTQSDIKNIPNIIDRFGLKKGKIDCSSFNSRSGEYVVCYIDEVVNNTSNITKIQYSKLLASEGNSPLVDVQGLSGYEENGRWSDSNHVEWSFINCINHKNMTLSLIASAYGPNVNKEFIMHVADQSFSFRLNDNFSTTNFDIDNEKGECIKSIRIDVPSPVSPKELGESGDSRKLGILIQSLTISKK